MIKAVSYLSLELELAVIFGKYGFGQAVTPMLISIDGKQRRKGPQR